MTAPDLPTQDDPATDDGAPAEELRGALRRLAARDGVLLALDFDGCLAPFVVDPEDARPLPAASDALERLARLPGTAIARVSGRPLETLRRLATPPPQALLVGSHGAEFAGPDGAPLAADALGGTSDDGTNDGTNDAPAHALLARLEAAVTELVAAHPGTALERKPTAAVLHTRGADRTTAAAATSAALAGPATWAGVRAMRGKEVVELSVSDATKGAALRRLRALTGTAPGPGGVLYAGDDVTDETAFAVLDDDAGDVTVKVGPGETGARHRVPDPQAVACLLQELAALRELAFRGAGG